MIFFLPFYLAYHPGLLVQEKYESSMKMNLLICLMMEAVSTFETSVNIYQTVYSRF
jgi:hypothetical protein